MIEHQTKEPTERDHMGTDGSLSWRSYGKMLLASLRTKKIETSAQESAVSDSPKSVPLEATALEMWKSDDMSATFRQRNHHGNK
jgi:hypothetical protein